jgi:hypothetical protein
MSDDPKWMEHATEKMKKKGTLGSFGKYSAKKVARKKKEGVAEKKKAVFAENVHKAAMKRKHKYHGKRSSK